MNTKNVIDYKMKKIINLAISKGVQPEELMENIWNKQYKSINVYKDKKNIICKLIFLENRKEIEMHYVYNKEKELIKIIEIINNKSLIFWDKDIKLQELIDDVVELLSYYCTNKEIEKILNTLPDTLRQYAKTKINIA